MQALLDAMREQDPRSVLVVGTGGVAEAAAAYGQAQPAAVITVVRDASELAASGSARYDVALVGDVIGLWPDAAARALLGALRDRYCTSAFVLAAEGAWPLTDYLALGFERRDAANGLELYEYHVDRFNAEREWNNPDHWANPENFKRFRW